MNDELQADEGTVETNESQETETTNESGAELAPATGEDQSKNEDGVQKMYTREEATALSLKGVNKQHARYREEERRANKLEKERNALKDELEAIEANKGDVNIPSIPDPFDDDFEEKVKVRDEAIMQKAAQDAQKNVVIEQQNANNEAAQKAEQERSESLVKGFDSQIVKLGLEPEEIRGAVNTIVEYGISKDVGEFILQHEDGPLITKYLAANPIELDELRNMSPINAALKINSTIKNAASTMKPQASQAPDPAETLSGRGAGEQVNPLIKGVTFE